MTMLGNFGVRWCELVRGTGALTRLYASLVLIYIGLLLASNERWRAS